MFHIPHNIYSFCLKYVMNSFFWITPNSLLNTQCLSVWFWIECNCFYSNSIWPKSSWSGQKSLNLVQFVRGKFFRGAKKKTLSLQFALISFYFCFSCGLYHFRFSFHGRINLLTWLCLFGPTLCASAWSWDFLLFVFEVGYEVHN